jgi:hypothetical protein
LNILGVALPKTIEESDNSDPVVVLDR